MTLLSRVVWSEGMHLAQHHFQAQSRYFESAINFALSQLFFKSYGVAGCELDAEALRNGTVALIHARGVMPDGLPFHFPDSDSLPAPLEIRDRFSPTQESHLLLLTIPSYRPGHSNCALQAEGDREPLRYLAESSRMLDETTGRDEKAVEVGRKNFQLMLDAEGHEDLVSLPLARVRRDGTGHFIYDPGYIPPCLQIGASARLLELLRRLIEILEAKANALAMERRERHKSLADYAAHEVASFWLSHAIHSSLTPLRHHLTTKRSRPVQLYEELARLAGALCTFSLESHPSNLPLYDHDHLDTCFNGLDQHIRTHLEITIPTNRVIIPLTAMTETEFEAAAKRLPKRAEKAAAPRQRAETPYFFSGAVKDPRCLAASEWFLSVKSSADEAQVVAKVPNLVKICSAEFIVRLVQEAMPGLALEHVASPPTAISPRIGCRYFKITRSGPCWDVIRESATVGVYVPGALPDAELELVIVVENG